MTTRGWVFYDGDCKEEGVLDLSLLDLKLLTLDGLDLLLRPLLFLGEKLLALPTLVCFCTCHNDCKPNMTNTVYICAKK